MREDVIDPAAVNIERLAQVFLRHGRAFDVPAGIADTPGAVPAQNVLRLGDFPQREVFRVALVFAHIFARPGFLLLEAAVGQLAIVRPASHVKIDVAVVGNVGVPFVEQRLDHLDLFGDVAAGARADVGADDAERVHIRQNSCGRRSRQSALGRDCAWRAFLRMRSSPESSRWPTSVRFCTYSTS